MNIAFRYAARSDIGLTRSNNQDSAYAGPHLLAVADGMGGHAGGDIASSVAIAHIAPLDDENPSAEQAVGQLDLAIEQAHDELISLAVINPDLAGLGTTLTALIRSGNKLVIGHIGDSRAYLLRDGVFEQITTDHSFVNYLVETGKLTPEQAEHHPQRSLLLRVLGDVDMAGGLDISVRETKPGDRWLLCSDGLSSVVSSDTLKHVLTTVSNPGLCADQFVDLALRGGGPDNVTCIVADVLNLDQMRDGEAPSTQVQVVGSAATDRDRPTRGTSGAAGRAAAVISPSAPPPPQEAKKAEHSHHRGELADQRKPSRVGRRLMGGIIALVVVIVLAGGGIFGYRWTQTQYFIGEANGQIAIYQGVSQTVGPIKLSHVHSYTGVSANSLPSVYQTRLKQTIPASSLSDAQAKLTAFEQQANAAG